MNHSNNLQLAYADSNETGFHYPDDPSLIHHGFMILNADHYESADIDVISKEFLEFRESYSRMPMDRFMMDNGCYRQRRFSRWKITKETLALENLPQEAFFQAKEINQLNGGVARSFEPMEEKIQQSKFFKALIRFHFQQLPGDHKECMVFAHQIRIIGNNTVVGMATPEGIHRDGHAYVAQIMIGRKNVVSAKSRLYTDDGELIKVCELKKPLDSILLDDQRMLHSVDSLLCADNGEWATRDMLLLDFNPIKAPSFTD